LTKLLLGVDLGTSSLKTALFTPDGRLLALAQVPCRPDSPHPGWAEMPPERWWRALKSALRKLRREKSGRLKDVAGVGFSVLFPAVIPMDGDGRPLRPAILYCDQRSLPQVTRLAGRKALAPIERQIANRVVPGTCAASSMLWIRDRETEIYRRTKLFGHANSYVVGRLTGRTAMDRTNASLTGLVKMGREDRFSPALAERFGLDVGKMPPIVTSTEVAGEITARAARETGLPAGAPVVMGSGDAVTAAFGAGLARLGNIFYAAGTTDCALVAVPRPPRDTRFANCAYCLPDLWASIATITSSGAAVDWFAHSFLGLRRTATDVESLGHGCAPGSEGVMFLPYLQGERTPIWDPEARGVFMGLKLASGLPHMARAVLEGTALGLRQAIDTLEKSYGLRGSRIVAVGGGTRNDLWMRIKASALGRSIRVMEFQETSTLGAAMMAGLGVGIYGTAAVALRATAVLRNCRTVRPVRRWRVVYEELYPVYCRLHGALKEDFRVLGRIARSVSAPPPRKSAK